MMLEKRWIRGCLAAAVCAAGCVHQEPLIAGRSDLAAVASPAVSPAAGRALSFSFLTPDGSVISAESMRGRSVLVALVTTYDWGSQLLLRRVNQTLRSHVPRINAFGVVLETANYSVLLDTFSRSLDLAFPLAMADEATLNGGGAFAPVNYVPTLLVLDAQSRLVASLQGPVARAEIEAALRQAEANR